MNKKERKARDELIVADYNSKKYTLSQIAKKHGLSAGSINAVLSRCNVQRHGCINEVDWAARRNKIVQEYLQSVPAMSQDQLAERYEVSRARINAILAGKAKRDSRISRALFILKQALDGFTAPAIAETLGIDTDEVHEVFAEARRIGFIIR